MKIRFFFVLDLDGSMIFEVNLVSLTQMSIVFEHPMNDMMASVEFDLNDVTLVKGTLLSLGDDPPLAADEYICKVVQR